MTKQTTVATVAAAGSIASASQPQSTFEGLNLNHVALRVTDVERSRDFYMKHLGLTVARQSLPNNCFLSFGDCFLALFRGDRAGMDHYCYSIKEYNVNKAAEKLKAEGIDSEIHDNRIYFPDPDGLKVQLSAFDHRP